MPDNIHKTTAKFLKEKRQAIGLTQRQVASQVFGDIRRQDQVCKIEGGKIQITLETLGKFLEIYNSSINFLEN